MKVIKKGRQQKGWAKQITCTGKGNGRGGCGAVLLIEESDLFQTSHSDMAGDTDYFVTFKCSECGVLTDINSWPGHPRDLPKRPKTCTHKWRELTTDDVDGPRVCETCGARD